MKKEKEKGKEEEVLKEGEWGKLREEWGKL